MNGIATRLKCALGDTGFTQKELAQMTGLTEVSISRYVNGSRVPKATTLARIADALGVGMGYFFDSVAKDTNVPSTDCISRQETIDAVNKALDRETIIYSFVRKVAIDSIKTLPTAQPEMVKCKKCRYVHYDEEFDNYWCNRMSDSFKVEADGYCKWGK